MYLYLLYFVVCVLCSLKLLAEGGTVARGCVLYSLYVGALSGSVYVSKAPMVPRGPGDRAGMEGGETGRVVCLAWLVAMAVAMPTAMATTIMAMAMALAIACYSMA